MSTTFARRLAYWAAALAVTVAATALGSTPADAAAPRLALTALSFEQSTLDVTEQSAANKLTWTVTNTDQDAYSIYGTVTMRMRSSVTGLLVGHERTARYEFENTCCGDSVFESGTPQESTYSYYLPVRQYAGATSVTWEVTRLTIGSDGSTATISGARLQSFGAKFTALTLIDASGPTVDRVSLESGREPYFYVGNDPATVYYDFTVQDGESGFWKGTIRMAGPHGASVSIPFTWERDEYSTGVRCGRVSSGDDFGTYMACLIGVTLPSDAAAGTWRLASLVLQNNAGGTTTYKNPAAPSVTTTYNATVSASDFAIAPNPVNNWRDDVLAEVSMSISGAQEGISSVLGSFSSGCRQWGTGAVKEDGRVTIPVLVYRQTQRCTVTGITVLDVAGNVALYGDAFGAPDPGLTITQLPSIDPPMALSASLDPSSVPASQAGQRSIKLTIKAEVKVAPINGTSVYLYDADNNIVYQSFGGNSQAADGTVTTYVYLPWEGLAPGQYTVGFGLDDAARKSSWWNTPDRTDSQTLPGGPVVLTVTEG